MRNVKLQAVQSALHAALLTQREYVAELVDELNEAELQPLERDALYRRWHHALDLCNEIEQAYHSARAVEPLRPSLREQLEPLPVPRKLQPASRFVDPFSLPDSSLPFVKEGAA